MWTFYGYGIQRNTNNDRNITKFNYRQYIYMAQTTSKIKKLVSIADKHWDMIQQIMNDDGVSSLSVAIGYLIVEENKRRGKEVLPIIKV